MTTKARYTPGVWVAQVRYPGREGLVPVVCATAEILGMVLATAEVVRVEEVGAGGLQENGMHKCFCRNHLCAT